jgi:hypothetical protein
MKVKHLFFSSFLFLFSFDLFGIVKGSESAVSIEPFFTFLSADSDNTMLGFGWFKNGFALEDASTTCTFNSIYPIGGSVSFNGGSLYLLQDLLFKHGTVITSFGKLYGNDHIVDFAGTVTHLGGQNLFENIHLGFHNNFIIDGPSDFHGDCCIHAENYRVTLGSSADLVVKSNSTLSLKNMALQLMSGSSLRCEDDTATLVLDDVIWMQDGSYTFSAGAIIFNGNVDLLGSGTFFYESNQTSTINGHARVTVSDGLCLSIGRQDSSGPEPLEMIDATASLKLENASLFITSSGMYIDRGTIITSKEVKISIDSTTTDYALSLGNGTAASDIKIVIEPTSVVDFFRGPLVLNTLNKYVISSISPSAKIIRNDQSILYVKQDIIFGSMLVDAYPLSTFVLDEGKNVDFDDGHFVFPVGKFKITGSRYDQYMNLLNGNDSIFILEGLYPLPTFIANRDNTMRGSGSISGDIVLQDNAADLSIALDGSLLANITLNGGKVKLESNLQLGPNVLLIGSGVIDISSYALQLGTKDLTLSGTYEFQSNSGSIDLNSYVNLLGTYTFSGDCLINGRGNTLNLQKIGRLVIDPSVQLTLRNIRIEGLGADQITLLADDSRLILDDVSWIQEDNIVFDTGSILFENNVEFSGSYTFSYESSQTSTISGKATWMITDGMKLSIGRYEIDSAEPLWFENNTSILCFNNCCYSVTSSGMQITTGRIVTEKDVKVEINSTDTATGFILGNGTVAGNMVFELNPGSSVRFTKGILIYDVMDDSSLQSHNITAMLQRDAQSTFYLKQDMMLSNVTASIDPLSTLHVEDGKFLKYAESIVKLPTGTYKLIGTRLDAVTNLFDGNDSVMLQNGDFPFVSVINQRGNKFYGNGSISGPIYLTDNGSELSIDLDGFMSNNITLQESTLNLYDDLQLTQNYALLGTGTVNLGNAQIKCAYQDLNWTGSFVFNTNGGGINFNGKISLSSTWTIQGNCTIQGNGNELDLSHGGNIILDSGAMVHLKNLRLSGISGSNITCVDNTATLILDDVIWIQNGDFTFQYGSINFIDEVIFSGEHVFDYASNLTSTIDVKSQWHMTDGIKVKIGRKSLDGNEPLSFVDKTSITNLDNCSLIISYSGIQITKGRIIANRDVEIEIQSTDTSNGFTLGDGTLAGDMIFELNPGVTIRFTMGHLVYDIVTDGSLRSRSTTAQLIRSAASSFYIKQTITLVDMTINAAVGSELTIENGIDLAYDNCIIVLPEGEMKLTGKRINVFTNALTNGSIFMQNGGLPLYTIISGATNSIQGNGSISGAIILADSNAVVNVKLDGQVTENVMLNGGLLKLDQDLYLSEGKLFLGTGTVDLSGQRLHLGSNDLIWTDSVFWDGDGGLIDIYSNVALSGRWTFSGNTTVNFHDFTFDLSSGGEIIIDQGSSLKLLNTRLKGLAGNNIRCLDDAGSLTLENIDWLQDANFHYSNGNLYFDKNIFMSGSGKVFTYQSSQEHALSPRTNVKLDSNFTYSYDPINASKDLLAFADDTSCLILNGATLHATVTGMNLKKGTLKIKGKSTISSESIDEGITFGDGILASNDMACAFYAGAQLKLLTGSLVYKNLNTISWYMPYTNSELYIDSGSRLALYESLNFEAGTLLFGDNTTLSYVEGKDIIGSMGQLGSLLYTFT